MTTPPLTRGHYEAIAAFRYRLRLFLAFSEAAAAEVGLPAQQHQALLIVAGHAEGAAPTIGHVAQRLVIEPQTATELVARMVATGLLVKRTSALDARRQELALTAKAADLLQRLTTVHLRELSDLRDVLTRAVDEGIVPTLKS